MSNTSGFDLSCPPSNVGLIVSVVLPWKCSLPPELSAEGVLLSEFEMAFLQNLNTVCGAISNNPSIPANEFLDGVRSSVSIAAVVMVVVVLSAS